MRERARRHDGVGGNGRAGVDLVGGSARFEREWPWADERRLRCIQAGTPLLVSRAGSRGEAIRADPTVRAMHILDIEWQVAEGAMGEGRIAYFATTSGCSRGRWMVCAVNGSADALQVAR